MEGEALETYLWAFWGIILFAGVMYKALEWPMKRNWPAWKKLAVQLSFSCAMSAFLGWLIWG